MRTRLAVTVAVFVAALCANALASSAGDKRQAIRWANAVNLRGDELYGFRPMPPGSVTGTDTDILRSNECGAVAPGRDQIAYVPSSVYGRADGTSGQDVSVRVVWSALTALASPWQARLEAQGLASARAINCLKRHTRPAGTSPANVDVSVSKLRHLIKGATGVRVTAVATNSGGAVVSVHLDVFAFPQGTAVVTLVTMGIQGTFGDAAERQLLKLLKARARVIPARKRASGAPDLQG